LCSFPFVHLLTPFSTPPSECTIFFFPLHVRRARRDDAVSFPPFLRSFLFFFKRVHGSTRRPFRVEVFFFFSPKGSYVPLALFIPPENLDRRSPFFLFQSSLPRFMNDRSFPRSCFSPHCCRFPLPFVMSRARSFGRVFGSRQPRLSCLRVLTQFLHTTRHLSSILQAPMSDCLSDGTTFRRDLRVSSSFFSFLLLQPGFFPLSWPLPFTRRSSCFISPVMPPARISVSPFLSRGKFFGFLRVYSPLEDV